MSITLTAKGAKVAGAAFETAFKMLADSSKGGSLVGYAQAGIIEPSCLIDDSLRNSDMLADAIQLANSVYAAYFMRAFSMHNISIGGSSAASRLEKFSTHRSPTAAAYNTLGSISGLGKLALEEFDDRLVTDGEIRELPADLKELEEDVKRDLEATAKLATGLEANNFTLRGQKPAGKATPVSNAQVDIKDLAKSTIDNLNTNKTSVAFSKSIDIGEPVNVGVGRMINVTVKEDDKEVQLPVQIRLNAMYMATGPLLHILASSSQDFEWGPRFRKWRLNGIDFWRDLVFCQDQIDIHKKNLKADKTGVYLQIMQRRRQNSISAAISGSLSANSASNIIFLSEESAKELELQIYGKLADFNTRQKLFQQGYGMLMFVINKQWGTVRMYTRDIPGHTEIRDQDLKAANKRGGIDIGDVLAAYRTGSSPRL